MLCICIYNYIIIILYITVWLIIIIVHSCLHTTHHLHVRTDAKQQKFDVLSFITENSTPLGITWERIADTLEHFMDMGNLARDIRRKFAIDQHAGTEGLYIMSFLTIIF